MIGYQNTQPAWLMRVVLAVSILVSLYESSMPNDFIRGAFSWSSSMALVLALLAVLVLFYSLTVRIQGPRLLVRFGPGVIRFSFALNTIEDVRCVKTSWLNGWGIRKIRGGWLFNVSGFDAVEIRLTSGKVYWIGTNDPQGLAAALTDCLQSTPSDKD
jgi:hypothetical protein